MEVKIDSAGRVVIPKPLRDSMGVIGDDRLELTSDGGGVRLEPIQKAAREVLQEDGLPLLAAIPGVRISDEDVRRLRDESQR